jgi:hypothetical protein
MSRGEAQRTLSQRAIDEEYREAGILVNLDGRVPIDEAAPCYKSSREVVQAVLDAGLAEVEHELWPLSSLKGTDERSSRAAQKERKRERTRENRKQRRGEDDVVQQALDEMATDTDALADTASDAGPDTEAGSGTDGDETGGSSHHY